MQCIRTTYAYPGAIDMANQIFLRHAWHNLLSYWNVASRQITPALAEVCRHYDTTDRAYHNLDHLEQVLKRVKQLIPNATDPHEVELAAWLHDVIYDSKASDNEERSAEYALQLCQSFQIPNAAIITGLIRATKAHEAKGDANASVLLDADLSILGASEEEYLAYSKKIRQEYAWVPETEYRSGRRFVLDRFLTWPTIFHYLYDLEIPARRNIAAEIARLSL
jgi:predicted metal-dependent HD superfamily phosphohydrolase